MSPVKPACVLLLGRAPPPPLPPPPPRPSPGPRCPEVFCSRQQMLPAAGSACHPLAPALSTQHAAMPLRSPPALSTLRAATLLRSPSALSTPHAAALRTAGKKLEAAEGQVNQGGRLGRLFMPPADKKKGAAGWWGMRWGGVWVGGIRQCALNAPC